MAQHEFDVRIKLIIFSCIHVLIKNIELVRNIDVLHVIDLEMKEELIEPEKNQGNSRSNM